MTTVVVFRADGGGTVGMGHLSRCKALADVLKEGGGTVLWATRDDPAVKRVLGAPPDLKLAGALSL